jgi:hypothetical protein
MIGDTDSDNPLLSDDEVESFIAYRQITNVDDEDVTNIPAAAADAADAIAAKFAREFNFSEDGQRFDRAQKYAHYIGLSAQLRRRAGGASIPYSTT